jgi:hypothetical protein
MRIKDVIAHLFDFHVMGKKSWTLDQLAGWVQTLEPEEISPMATADQLYPGGVISVESRLDRLQAEARMAGGSTGLRISATKAISPHIAGRPGLS